MSPRKASRDRDKDTSWRKVRSYFITRADARADGEKQTCDRGTCPYCGKNVLVYIPKNGDGRKILSKYYSPLSGREQGYE
jgi:hypothetical protein